MVPRFREEYTFHTDIKGGGVRVWLGNKLIIDRWGQGSPLGNQFGSKDAPITSKAIGLKAGKSYVFKLEYRQYTGDARLVLKWSSPSTPEEVIDPLSVNGFNLINCPTALFADDVKYCMVEEYKGDAAWFRVNDRPDVDTARSPGLPNSDLDASFWPKKDFLIWLNPYFATATTYRIQFSGKADVALRRTFRRRFPADIHRRQ